MEKNKKESEDFVEAVSRLATTIADALLEYNKRNQKLEERVKILEKQVYDLKITKQDLLTKNYNIMKENINAQEAHFKTKEVLTTTLIESRYKYAMTVIELAIDGGLFYCYLSSPFLNKEVVEKLKKEGYTVKKDFFGDYTISW